YRPFNAPTFFIQRSLDTMANNRVGNGKLIVKIKSVKPVEFV
ncbi:MAG: hypothetical protein ACI9A7_002575, partial [Cyclobacteriaceae bacterium]